MKLGTFLATTLVAIGAASCGENSQPATQTNTSAATAVQSPGMQAQPQAQGQTPVRAPQAAVPIAAVPPADAKWTILCDKVEGPAHVAEATMVKSRLIQTTGLNDWYVIHTENESSIYFGYYRDLDNPAEKKRADSDRARLAALTDSRGNPLIRGNVLVAVAQPDPEAPADWNLLNTPPDAYWTIEVATFAGDAKRKEAAVQYVRELRAGGEKNAYYYHGPTASSVCIGAWKRSAVAEQAGADAHTQAANQPLLVMGDVLPPNMPSRVFEPGTGKPMTVVAPRLEILDPDMRQKTKDYPQHLVNYQLRATSGGQPDPSVLVAIPHEQSVASGQDDWHLGGSGSPGSMQPSTVSPVFGKQSPSSPGDSALRSIGDK